MSSLTSLPSTLAGARALGLAAEIGSIEPGKAADLAAIDLGTIETLPCFDPVSHVVYAAGREHVTHAGVAGEIRLEDRHLTGVDLIDLHDRAIWWQSRIS